MSDKEVLQVPLTYTSPPTLEGNRGIAVAVLKMIRQLKCRVDQLEEENTQLKMGGRATCDFLGMLGPRQPVLSHYTDRCRTRGGPSRQYAVAEFEMAHERWKLHHEAWQKIKAFYE